MSNGTQRNATGKRIRKKASRCNRIGTGRSPLYKGRPFPDADADAAAEPGLTGTLPDAKPSRCESQQVLDFADGPDFAPRKPMKPPLTPYVDQLKAARQRELARHEAGEGES